MKLECKFHALVYEIECQERADQVRQLVHPILKRGHSNAVEASHNVLIRFRSKDIFIERLHYHVSTNLGLLQANLTYMHKIHGTSYHWIPDLYHRMSLPVFDGVVDALEKYNVQRKRELDKAQTTPVKKRRIALKRSRVREGVERMKWSKLHGHDTYGDVGVGVDSDPEHGVDNRGSCVTQRKERRKGTNKDRRKTQEKRVCAACGSNTHQRTSHKDCPYNTSKGTSASVQEDKPRNTTAILEEDLKSDVESASSVISSNTRPDEDMLTDFSSSVNSSDDENVLDGLCTCRGQGRAHNRDCPLSSRKRYTGRSLFSVPRTSAIPCVREPANVSSASIKPPDSEKSVPMEVGDYVCIHSRRMGTRHIPCRIAQKFNDRYQLYCRKGVLDISFSHSELLPLARFIPIPLDKWRQAPKVSLRSIANDPSVTDHCDCNVSVEHESIVIPSGSEDEAPNLNVWVSNTIYRLTHDDRELVLSHSGWLTDKIITAAQMLILQHFPNVAGLQPPTLQKVFAFQVHCGEFVQIINISNNHWCVVSTVGCDSGVINVYDSLPKRTTPDKTIRLIASLVSCPSSTLTIRTMDVARQSNGSNCGVLAIAYAFDICSSLNPCNVIFASDKIRQHLILCLEQCNFARFPVQRERRCALVKFTKTVELYCTCRMPEEEGVDEMVECDSCHEWYHRHCMDIPNEVFGPDDVPWECKACTRDQRYMFMDKL